jgi:hypothetical protein
LESNGAVLVLGSCYVLCFVVLLQERQAMKKIRSVRVSDQLWAKAKAKAQSEGKTVSEVIVDYLKEFVK